MKFTAFRRIMAGVLAVLMLATLLPLAALAAPVTYTMDVSKMETKPRGTWENGDIFRAGTEDYFTVFCSETTRIDGSEKTFSDGFESTQRLNFNSGTSFEGTILNAVQIKTTSPATVKLWWVSGGDDREVAVFDEAGTVLQQSKEGSIKNQPYIATFQLDTPNTYYIANIGGNNNYVKLEVTEENPAPKEPRAAWDKVAAPKIVSAKDNGDGTLTVTVKANVGHHGGDQIVVTMHDAEGKELSKRKSILEREEHTLVFEPEGSGKYTFQAVLTRSNEADKPAKKDASGSFKLPLGNPALISATSKGNGTVALTWTGVLEAEKYDIFCDGKAVASAEGTEYTVEGLTVGQKYTFQVKAVRGKDVTASGELSCTATADAKATWGFTRYGPSTGDETNGYVGSLNEDGKVTVYSEGGKGKIVPASVDGVAFYYTAVPTDTNFTLRAKVTIDSWAYSNGQEGFGLLVTDRLGPNGDSGNFWNNQIMAAATKIEYRYDPDSLEIHDLDGTGTKYSMKLGLGVIAKSGVTPDNLSLMESNNTNIINKYFLSETYSLEDAAGEWEKEAGTYNIVGNCVGEVSGSIDTALLTEFDLEIQKNNTGYFVTYYAEDGTVLAQRKFYGTDMLSQLDADYVYAGFFAARNARATFSDVKFTTIAPSEDAPAEEKPIIKVEPTVTLVSPTVTTSKDYTLGLDANVSGTVEVSVNRQVVASGKVKGEKRFTVEIPLADFGENDIRVRFTPDADQELGEDMALASTADVTMDTVVTCNKGFYHRKNIYVSPKGQPNGNATKEYPLDIYTAVNNATPGQTIILMEGTYNLRSTLRIQRGMDGTKDAPIRMIADPEAKSRPVLDFQSECAGIVHGGNYWYFAGFDVTNTGPTLKGFQISGSNNILDQIHTYRNGSTGIQISRYSGSDTTADWPCDNLVLNCTSYLNADPGEEDADGFACKLTSGTGNVFDGCVAYRNADDGWDLYAKVETGTIGAVTIRNCVAYQNGIREDGTVGEGNGNGFKMGGESLSGKHKLENSYAFWNKAKGIDSNSCPDIQVENCISYNNGSYNVALYTNNAAETDFVAKNILSVKDGSCPYEGSVTLGDNLKPKGDQNELKFKGDSAYYWNGTAAASSAGSYGAEVFQSVEFKGVARKEDGAIDMQGFLTLTAAAPAGVAPQGAGTASGDMTSLPTDEAHTYGEEWYKDDHFFHWRECQCGDRGHYGEHDLKWIVDKKATETENGRKHQECTVCGYKQTGIETYYEPVSTTLVAVGIGAALLIAAAGVLGFVIARKKKQK